MKTINTRCCLYGLFISVFLLFTPAAFAELTLDPQFGREGNGVALVDFHGNGDKASGIAVQKDGKILVAGYAKHGTEDKKKSIALARYDAKGKLDPTFGNDAGFITLDGHLPGEAFAVALQKTGNIIIAGYSANEHGGKSIILCRFKPEGQLDTSFASGKGYMHISFRSGDYTLSSENWADDDDKAYDIAIQQNDKIVITGFMKAEDGKPHLFVTRLNNDGGFDNSFSENGALVLSELHSVANAIALGVSGTIFLAGSITNNGQTDGALFKVTSEGEYDTGFGESGTVRLKGSATKNYIVKDLALQSDKKIIIAGTTVEGEDREMFLARFSAGGEFENQFGKDNGLAVPSLVYNNEVHGVGIDKTDGTIYGTGYGQKDTTKELLVFKYDKNGTFSQSITAPPLFLAGGEGAGGQALLVQSDRALLVAGFSNNGEGENVDFALLKFINSSATGNDPDDGTAEDDYDITTTPISHVTGTSVLSGGTVKKVSDNSSLKITARGVCFGITPHPVYRPPSKDKPSDQTPKDTPPAIWKKKFKVIRHGQTSDGAGAGEYGSEIVNFNPGILYYVRSYAVLSDKNKTVIYGNNCTFKTNDSCFIATAAFGSLMEDHVVVLREFRDVYLKGNLLGEKFIAFYYKWSPPIADLISTNDTLRAITRTSLSPLVLLCRILLNRDLSVKSILMGFMVLLIFLFYTRVRILANSLRE